MHARKTVAKTASVNPNLAMIFSGFVVGSVFGPFGAVIAMAVAFWLTKENE